jgi:hypothetical protein
LCTKSGILKENAEHIINEDSAGNPLTGEKNYRLLLSPGIPASNFWSVIVYDIRTKLIIHTDQPWPSVYSSCRKLVVNQDGSVDIWFGPKSLPGKEHNWIKTIRKKGWYMSLRLYDPLKAWFDKTWKPGEIEEVI